MSEKFCLKWNDYQSNWNKALNELWKDTDFADVTLISDDKVKFSAHRILLTSCSNLFKFILKGNIQKNALLYLSGVNSHDLGFILDYIYHGEVNIYQNQLDSFLESAQKLEIEGLLGGTEESHENVDGEKYVHSEPEEHIENAQEKEKGLVRMVNEVNKIRKTCDKEPKDVEKIDVGSLDTGEIDKRMRELYEKTDEGWRCLVCDYTSSYIRNNSPIRNHVETHMDGLVYTCNLCSKEFRSRNILGQHKMNTHKTKWYFRTSKSFGTHKYRNHRKDWIIV